MATRTIKKSGRGQARSRKVGRGDTRQLRDLASIGPAMLEDFRVLGIQSVAQLKRQSAQALFDRLCRLTSSRQDPCVLDTFTCAIAQAKNPRLPAAQCDWWYWSRVRKSAPKTGGPKRRVQRGVKSRAG